ncbi:hypothetical protein [Niallia nealsonii]|uniref:Uncharacterized protein n=1 Tax=Niallia nealsonii TaxID=115979 RepID=A0A2N0Z327_9BACI|nr:hypothetical protein [Niallia nealsonii]PKG23918.1 hypothetical protein CWS01_09095 [Niallia nealsonii]
MLDSINKNINDMLDILNLSLNSFNEDMDIFSFYSPNYNLNYLNVRELRNICLELANSLTISFRSLDLRQITATCTDENLQDIEQWIEANKNKNNIQLTVKFSKKEFLKDMLTKITNQANKNIVFFLKLDEFKNSISYEKIKKSLIINDGYTFVLLPFYNITLYKNNFISIIGNLYKDDLFKFLNETVEIVTQERILSITKKQKLYCNMGSLMDGILPDHLFFKELPIKDVTGIANHLNYYTMLLCLHYIANISAKEEFFIHGYKNIHLSEENTKNITNETVDLIFQLYDTIYNVHTQDKLLVTRNVLSIHLSSESTISEFIELVPELFASVNANFDSYVQDKVKSFFDKKKDLEKYIRDTSESISKQITAASDNLNKSWLTLAGALIAGIITYSSRGNIFILIFFFIIFGILSVATLKYSVWIAEKEKESLSSSYNHFINLVDGISTEEKEKIIGTIVTDKFGLLDSTIKKMKKYTWMIPIILSISLLILISYHLYSQPEKDEKNNINKNINQSVLIKEYVNEK